MLEVRTSCYSIFHYLNQVLVTQYCRRGVSHKIEGVVHVRRRHDSALFGDVSMLVWPMHGIWPHKNLLVDFELFASRDASRDVLRDVHHQKALSTKFYACAFLLGVRLTPTGAKHVEAVEGYSYAYVQAKRRATADWITSGAE